jgi:hypothetical protein
VDPALRTATICLAVGIALDALILCLWIFVWP